MNKAIIIGTVLLLILLAGCDPVPTVCEEEEEILASSPLRLFECGESRMFCNHLSGTEKTCYPNADSRLGSKLCRSGWVLVDDEPAPPAVRLPADSDFHCSTPPKAECVPI